MFLTPERAMPAITPFNSSNSFYKKTMFELKRYSPADAAEWNAFVAGSKNGTFLFDRSYMDYHADRFRDHSLMIYREGRLYALLPACIAADGTLWSHGGLTYGGVILSASASAADTMRLFAELNDSLRSEGIRRVVYKAVPWIYHRLPAEEDLYAIFRECNARLLARDISSAIFLDARVKWSHGRKCGVSKARNNGVTVEQSDNLAAFWTVLTGNLNARYGVNPVHTVGEMELLASRFPDRIKLYVALRDSRVVGGTLLYDFGNVVHSQYISADDEGKRLGAIDAIYDRILNHDFADRRCFDFGKSTVEHGHVLNESLIFQKEGFGGRGVCYDTYEWTL